jgi:type II secretory ATPase GspE/PulE/Tfp pilus assembly ATPase PilB-like protein
MLPAGVVERLIWLGGLWLVLAVAWAAACMWVERDAQRVFGKATPWTLGFVAIGTLLLLGSYLWGFATLPLFAILIPGAVQGYVIVRDRRMPETERIMSRHFVEKVALAASDAIGLGDTVNGWFQKKEAERQAAPRIQLVKKDGRPIDSKGKDIDKETSKAVKALEDLFMKAIDLRATDIHIDPKESGELQVRCRVDGIMGILATFHDGEGRGLVSALKVLGDMDIAERRRPQDGTFAVMTNAKRFDVRAATGPTNFGEKMVLRLLDADGGVVKAGVKSLGMRETVQKSLESIIHQPHGMLIVCGPTGSGKTTTLYTALGEIDTLSRNIVTIEDPIEYRLDNISQTAVNNAAELTFAKILRSVLRQDPDVILVGEIRDKETAEIAMQAALTGHFVFTTLHANDTATTVTRLLDIGIDSSLIQSAVTAVLAQRLVRVLCQECKEAVELSAEMKQKLNLPAGETVKVFKPKGCPACHGTGYKGRTGIHELLVFDKAIRELIVGSPSIEAIRAAARKAGMRTLREAGLAKVLAGVTCFDEVARVAK